MIRLVQTQWCHQRGPPHARTQPSSTTSPSPANVPVLPSLHSGTMAKPAKNLSRPSGVEKASAEWDTQKLHAVEEWVSFRR